jgi:hypothetical protein
MRLEGPVPLEEKPQGLSHHIAAMRVDELCIRLELLVGLLIKPETARFELAFRLRTDLWSYSCLSCN